MNALIEYGVRYSDTGEVAISFDRAEAESIIASHNANPAPLYAVAIVTRALTQWAEVTK